MRKVKKNKHLIKQEIKKEIFSGVYSSGEKLPSLKELSKKYMVHWNTLNIAVKELEKEGFIINHRTKGKTVTKNQLFIDISKKSYAKFKTDEFLKNLKEIDITPNELVELFTDINIDL